MIRNSGHADLPLHTGTVPRWLADRMMVMGTLIVESLVQNYGPDEVLVRLSDPLWFQSFGAVMGMDWHSSGITTSVLYALKRGLNPRAKELGIYVCGGRGKYSRMTPDELLGISEREGLNGDSLVRNSKLVAKVDNNALQDGFQLYQHNFILTRNGNWTVVQQGMNPASKTARRYHWCSADLHSFVENPHTGVVGENRGQILNLTDPAAQGTRSSILELSQENPDRIIKEIQQIGKEPSQMIIMQNGGSSPLATASKLSSATPCAGDTPATPPAQPELFEGLPPLSSEIPDHIQIQTTGRSLVMPAHHEVRAEDIDLKRLGGVLATAYENQPQDFESLLLTPGLGPRTLQSLTLVSEVIYGTPSRFTDPARFSFAHGGKDGHPFPVPLKIYDESIRILRDSIEKSKLGYREKSDCIRRLHQTALNIEQHCAPQVDFDAAIAYEHEHSNDWDGKTV
ncbi:DUF763 domain-containing protein [Treponema sp. C6A8]|uniref:DUF763 domain-containing protein n=1 Tax=Treponema sp. C6A8 TaxID=1410609 RepID=UPI0004809AC5|nr:DUF763 domain-containing protein [Treponema sp. C6A8]